MTQPGFPDTARFLFVGEKPSRKAHENGWTWGSERLAGRSLAQALDACGIPSDARRFVNLFGNSPHNAERPRHAVLELAKLFAIVETYSVVALGRKVSRALLKAGIAHRQLTHPAARGAIRKRERYEAHVRAVLTRAPLHRKGEP